MTTNFDSLLGNLTALAESLRGVEDHAIAEYTPIVESILRSRTRDVPHIERTLDGLLDLAGHSAGLQLFRRLCQHYWDIDPAATAEYVLIYRNLWEDSEEEVEP
jgi:hypothetical protein